MLLLQISNRLIVNNSLATEYSISANERVRPNKGAAIALLARTYLYRKDWVNAEISSDLVINQANLYALEEGLNEVFKKNNTEAIWQLIPTNRTYTNEGQIFILQSQPAYAALNDNLVNSFEPGDARRSAWINSITTAAGTWYYPFKYKDRSGSTSLKEYSTVLRLAEQYLVRAEARAQLDDITGAQDDLNIIRTRAGLPGLTLTDKPSLLSAIESERRHELFTEWGHRWFDLKRTGRMNDVLTSVKIGWQPADALLPIPESELLLNRSLEQNPGYN